MSTWLIVTVAWLVMAWISFALYWYEKIPYYKTPGNFCREAFLSQLVWPLTLYAAVIWHVTRRRAIRRFLETNTPYCARHGFMLLKCALRHEAFCNGCTPGRCPTCGEGPYLYGPPEHHTAS